MDGLRFVVAIGFDGTTSGVRTKYYTLPCDATLQRVDALATSAAEGTFDLGPSTDADGIINDGVPGNGSSENGIFHPADFNGALCDQIAGYHMVKDTRVVLAISNTSQIDLMFYLTFTEG